MTAVARHFFSAPTALRRVRKSDVVQAAARPDGLQLCLTLWKEWMSRSDTDLGIKSQSTLRADGDGYGSENTSQMRRDNEIAEATDAMILSLQSSYQWAIRRQCGIARGNVWNFPQLNYIEEAERARVELEKKLRNNLATGILW